MSANPKPEKPALVIAEEILRTICGDDLHGCTVSLESIATLIDQGTKQESLQTREVLDLYEKVVEALHLLSKPPDIKKVTDPNELRTLLSERLDAIQAITTKTIETTALVKHQQGGSKGA